MIVGRTTVVVAHRLSTIQGADIIAVVQQVRGCGSCAPLTAAWCTQLTLPGGALLAGPLHPCRALAVASWTKWTILMWVKMRCTQLSHTLKQWRRGCVHALCCSCALHSQ